MTKGTVFDEVDRHRRSVRMRLLLPLLAVLLPVILIQGFIYYDDFADRRAEELQKNIEIARAVESAFRRFVEDVHAQELAIGMAATASPNLPPRKLATLLRQSAKDYPAVVQFSWVGAEGRILASSNLSLEGTDLSKIEYLKEIASGREWDVSSLIQSKAEGALFFTISRAVRDEEGVLLGTVVADVLPEGLQRVLSSTPAKDTSVSLLDRNGRLVARHTEISFTWEARDILKFHPKLEAALRGEEVATTLASSRTGKKRLVAFVPVSSVGWVAAAGRSQEDVLRPVVSNLMTHGVLFLVVALAAFGSALTLSRSVSAPIDRLRDQARAIGRGKKVTAAENTGPSEIVELALAIEEMGERIGFREKALRESEEAARQRAEEIRKIMDLAPVAIWVSRDPQCGTIVGNTTANRLVDSARAAGACEKTRVLRSGCELRPEELPMREAARKRVEVRNAEIEILGARDSSMTLLGNASPLLDSEGEVRGCIAAFVDITERKQMEQALRQAKDELELRVQERTAGLKQRNQELQSFAFIASHDLKEPLRKIRAFGDLVVARFRDILPPEGADYIDRMQSAAARMDALLESLLSYSRVTTKGKPFVRVSLAQAVREALSNLELRIRESGAVVEVGRLSGHVEGDDVQLVQLFQNLIGNALKFRKDGEPPRIGVYAIPEEEGSRENVCRICIEDNGIGFDEKDRDKIFVPFERLHGRDEYDGMGMGLAICRKIVERHGGTITAKSAPGEGATFIVTLPVGREEDGPGLQ